MRVDDAVGADLARLSVRTRCGLDAPTDHQHIALEVATHGLLVAASTLRTTPATATPSMSSVAMSSCLSS